MSPHARRLGLIEELYLGTGCSAFSARTGTDGAWRLITFVGHRNSELLGSVSLEPSDLPQFDHLSPWLASLYVHAPFRGQGVGRTLVRHLQCFALSHGIGPLYLWTPGSTQLYEHCGWI